MKGLIGKISLSFIIITAAYYFLFLQPQHQLYQTQQALLTHRTNLVHNRLAITQLTKLQPNTTYQTQEQTGLLKQLQTTNKNSLENLKNQPPVPTKRLQEATTSLFNQTQTFLQNQQTLITQLQATNNLQVQQNLLKSQKAITLLTKQTNLILEYDGWIKQVNQSF